MGSCKTCRQYRTAEKPILGFHEYTGTCYGKRLPCNRVRATGYCESHELKKEFKTTT